MCILHNYLNCTHQVLYHLPLQELEHSSELLSKNHIREVKLLQSKNASLQHDLSVLDDEHNRLRKQLRVSACFVVMCLVGGLGEFKRCSKEYITSS